MLKVSWKTPSPIPSRFDVPMVIDVKGSTPKLDKFRIDIPSPIKILPKAVKTANFLFIYSLFSFRDRILSYVCYKIYANFMIF